MQNGATDEEIWHDEQGYKIITGKDLVEIQPLRKVNETEGFGMKRSRTRDGVWFVDVVDQIHLP